MCIKSIKSALRVLWYLVFDFFCFIFAIRFPKRQFDIVIVKPDGIGDFVLVSSYIKAVVNKYPQKSILIITGSLAFEFTCKSKEVYSLSVDVKRYLKSFQYRFDYINIFRAVSTDLLIVPVVSRNSTVIDSISLNVKSKRKVCIGGDFTNISLLGSLIYRRVYTEMYKPMMGCKHEIQVYNDFFKRVMGLCPKQVLPCIIGYNSKFISIDYLNLPDKYAVLAIGSSDNGKMWPLESFGQLASLLSHHVNGIVFVGNKNESHLVDIIINQNPTLSSTNLCGCVSLQATCKVIEGANIVIGNDSAVIHIAAILGKQSVAIAGGGHWGRFLPYPNDSKYTNPVVVTKKMDCFCCNWKCIKNDRYRAPYFCIDSVKVIDVIDATLPLLNKA